MFLVMAKTKIMLCLLWFGFIIEAVSLTESKQKHLKLNIQSRLKLLSAHRDYFYMFTSLFNMFCMCVCI